ncbi:GrpE protein-like protein [Rhodotorula toruloides]|uniref:GrpE protein homolog n=1 Tax=Rhodotorula toruloides TaxID=5286 RepID=A0A0K3CEG9_RHOTO|nr:GrpE protein-like protein [Rhodotorula toruloides]
MHAARSLARASRAIARPSPAILPRAAAAAVPCRPTFSPLRFYSAAPEAQQEPAAATAESAQNGAGAGPKDGKIEVDAGKVDELTKLLEEQKKIVAELKDARLRTLADFENLQKISTREKQQAKDFALQAFAKDLISEIDVLNLALRSIPAERLVSSSDHTPNSDLLGLHEGVKLTKRGIEKVLAKHGVVAFDPTGEQFDPNRHEALYQAPVPGKEPGSVLECQEIGYMIKDRLLRPAKVGVVLWTE